MGLAQSGVSRGVSYMCGGRPLDPIRGLTFTCDETLIVKTCVSLKSLRGKLVKELERY